MYSITQLQNLLTLHGFPAQYLWVIPIALILAGLALILAGKTTWKIAVGGGGAAAGYILAERYIAAHLVFIMPTYASELVFAVIASVLVAVLIRWTISAGAGYLAYYIALHQSYHPFVFWQLLVVAVVAFGAAFWLYGKITVIVAAFVGYIALLYGLYAYLTPEYASIAAVVILLIGLYYQVILKKELQKQAKVNAVKKLQRQERRKLRKQKRLEAKKLKLEKKESAKNESTS